MTPFLVIVLLLLLGVGIVVWHVTDPELDQTPRRKAVPGHVPAIDDPISQALEPHPTPRQTETRA